MLRWTGLETKRPNIWTPRIGQDSVPFALEAIYGLVKFGADIVDEKNMASIVESETFRSRLGRSVSAADLTGIDQHERLSGKLLAQRQGRAYATWPRADDDDTRLTHSTLLRSQVAANASVLSRGHRSF